MINGKIVVFCLSPLGDTIFATPALRLLRENVLATQVVVLASPLAGEVLGGNPWGLEIIVVSDQWDLLKQLAVIRKESYDWAVSFSQIGSFFTRFCAAKHEADFSGIDYQSPRSVVEMCLGVIGTMGILVRNLGTSTEFWVSDDAVSRTERFLRNAGYRGGTPLIAVHCGGHYFTRKRWGLDRFLTLIHDLVTRNIGQVILIGGNEEKETAVIIQGFIPKVINAVGRLKLQETGALLDRCQLFIGNDSGPLHLAAALHVPTIGLFGPTAPGQFYPYPAPHHRYIYKELPCSPCYRFGGGLWQYVPRCSKAYCMEAIGEGEVLELSQQMLLGFKRPVVQEVRT